MAQGHEISNRATAVSLGHDEAILEQCPDVLLLREHLAASTPEDRQ